MKLAIPTGSERRQALVTCDEERNPCYGSREEDFSASSESTIFSSAWDRTSSAPVWSSPQESSRGDGLFGWSQRDIVAEMNDLTEQSLQIPQSRMSSRLDSKSIQAPLMSSINNSDSKIHIGPSSSSIMSTEMSIPGLTTAFSGSQSQYSSIDPSAPSFRPLALQSQSSNDNFQTLYRLGSQDSQAQNFHENFPAISQGSFQVSQRQSTDKCLIEGVTCSSRRQTKGVHHSRPHRPLHESSNRNFDISKDTSIQSALSLASSQTPVMSGVERPILPPAKEDPWQDADDATTSTVITAKQMDWLMRMNHRLTQIPMGSLDPQSIPIAAIMNAWAKTKSSQGATMVETWLHRAQEEVEYGNNKIVLTTKMYTMAVDAWAKSGDGIVAATRAEAILQHMNMVHQKSGQVSLRPSTGIFNAVINAWARSRDAIAPVRAEQILEWMEKLYRSGNLDVQPDKYTYNTVIHAWAKLGGKQAAEKAQWLLDCMHRIHNVGNIHAKPDTITYNVVINAWAKSGAKGSANEAEKLLSKMHILHRNGDTDVKPNVVTYGAVIDAHAKSGERGAAARADALLADMIKLHQLDPITYADLRPNTYVFNTVINCWAKSKESDAASKAEEMLAVMGQLHASGMRNLKPDAFTYTAVIDAWAKSGYRGAATRADQLLDKMESKYQAGDLDLKPNTFTYNAVINALAKSGEPGAAARAERVLQNMVNRHRAGNDEVKPTTINFNTVLDAWAKSSGGRAAAERAEEILEWMDRLNKAGNDDVKPDTITFNAVLDAWARSGERMAPRRAEQILDHMDELYRAGNTGVKPDTYTYNTLINAWAKSSEKGAAERAEHVLSVMEKRHHDGDNDFKPNTRTYTSVIDAWAKSGEKGAAKRAEQIFLAMYSSFQKTGDLDVKPNVHTANAVCNACAFTKIDQDRTEALEIAFRVFDWINDQNDINADAYTYTILLSVCSNLIPREDRGTRFAHARSFFERCCASGCVNDYVLRKLRQTVTEEEFALILDYRTDLSSLPREWVRNTRGHHTFVNRTNSNSSCNIKTRNSNGRQRGRK